MADNRAITGTTYNDLGGAHQHGGCDHGTNASVRGLRTALALISALLVVEVVGGILSNSIALLADAGHLLTDVAALSLSLFVAWFSVRPETPRKTYGYLRWEILAALINGVTLILISVWIVFEAVSRFRTPQPISGGMMLYVSIIGLAVNIVAARMLHSSHNHNLNARGAYLHVLGDLLAIVGTLVAALLIKYTGWLIADPIASILTTLIITGGAWRLVRESVDVLLESTPAHIPLHAVRAQLEAIPGIESVHDLHVWAVTPAMVAMSAHAVVRDPSQHQHCLEHIHSAMRLFGVEHVTIQLEDTDMQQMERHLHA